MHVKSTFGRLSVTSVTQSVTPRTPMNKMKVTDMTDVTDVISSYGVFVFDYHTTDGSSFGTTSSAMALLHQQRRKGQDILILSGKRSMDFRKHLTPKVEAKRHLGRYAERHKSMQRGASADTTWSANRCFTLRWPALHVAFKPISNIDLPHCELQRHFHNIPSQNTTLQPSNYHRRFKISPFLAF